MASRSKPVDARWEPVPENRKPFNIKGCVFRVLPYAGLNLVLFIILAVLFFRAADAFRMLGFYLCAYGAMRFVLELFRGDVLRGIWLLSTSQWIALILIPLGIAMMCRPDRFDRALLRMQKKE